MALQVTLTILDIMVMDQIQLQVKFQFVQTTVGEAIQWNRTARRDSIQVE